MNHTNDTAISPTHYGIGNIYAFLWLLALLTAFCIMCGLIFSGQTFAANNAAVGAFICSAIFIFTPRGL